MSISLLAELAREREARHGRPEADTMPKRQKIVIDLDDEDVEDPSVVLAKRLQAEEYERLAGGTSPQPPSTEQQAAPAGGTDAAGGVSHAGAAGGAGAPQGEDAAFDHLASLVLYHRDDRHTAQVAEQQLRHALGGALTPRALLGVAGGAAGIARAAGRAAWVEKGEALRNLASAWTSLRAAPPCVRRGVRNDGDHEFDKAVTKVRGIGPWTIGEFFVGIGRTDVLMKECYEVQRGLKHLLASPQRAASGSMTPGAVKKWADDQGFRLDALTRVTAILRDVHRHERATREKASRGQPGAATETLQQRCAAAQRGLDELVR
tara:strand:+ start:62 stop:1021 length:960 start_codon:yes stop_codon:yes gene_type:complete